MMGIVVSCQWKSIDISEEDIHGHSGVLKIPSCLVSFTFYLSGSLLEVIATDDQIIQTVNKIEQIFLRD